MIPTASHGAFAFCHLLFSVFVNTENMLSILNEQADVTFQSYKELEILPYVIQKITRFALISLE